jgi:hypothetical protein
MPVLLLLMVLSSVAAKSARPPQYSPEDKGVNWMWDTAWTDLTTKQINWAGVETDARNMRMAGIDWARVTLSSDYNPATYDRLLRIARTNRVQILFCIYKSAPYKTFGTDEQEATDQDWIETAVRHFKPFVKTWEVQNEENLASSWDRAGSDQSGDAYSSGMNVSVAQYIKYLALCYRTIKKVDPTAMVMMGGLSDWQVKPWLLAFGRMGGGQYTDVFNIHPYAGSAVESVDQLNEVLSEVKLDPLLAGKPTWITEVGFQTESAWHGVPGFVGTETNKALALTAVMKGLRTAGVTTPIFWYALHESESGVHGFGLVVVNSEANGTETPLPAYFAEQNLWSESKGGA